MDKQAVVVMEMGTLRSRASYDGGRDRITYATDIGRSPNLAESVVKAGEGG